MIRFLESEGDIPELAGRTCERLLCVPSRRDDGVVDPRVCWLKIQDGN